MSQLEKEFEGFVRFCFEHGGTLRNHKEFSERAQGLRASIKAVEHRVQRTVKHAEDCAINIGMLGECDCGAED